MENLNINDALMIKVLEGNASKAEVEQFQNWLKERPENANEYADFQKIWDSAPDIGLLEKLDVEGDLAALKAKAIPVKAIPAKAVAAKEMPTKVIQLSMIRRIAAVLLPLIMVGTALFFYLNQTNSNEPVLLADGTKVWLYDDAKLDYPATFATDIRSVKLTGEAFFDVAKDATKPFVIHAGAADIRVLGTSFNVQSGHQETAVIVNTGKVQLIDRAAPQNLVELTKGEKGTFDKGVLEETMNTDKNYRSWQTGVFEFDGTKSIEEVVQQLSKYYGPIELSTTANPDCLFGGNFDKEELSTVLELIKTSCDYK